MSFSYPPNEFKSVAMSQLLPVAGANCIPPVWVLNLRRSAERRTRIARHLDELGIGFEFIEAIDGRTLSPEECARAIDAGKARRLLGRDLAPTEIACSLSHRMLYQKQVDEGWEAVVILEDDAVVDPAFLEVMKLRNALPPDWELVTFYRGETRVSFWGSRPLGRWRCVKFGSLAFGAVAYMLRLSGARKLLVQCDPVSVPADWVTGGAIRTGVHLYGIDPPCVRELTRDWDASTMPEANALARRWPKREELHPVVWRLHRAKWWLIHAYQRVNPFNTF
jgi:glycosyl transferase family 25